MGEIVRAGGDIFYILKN